LLFATQGVSGCGETAEPQQQQAEVDTTEFSVEPAPVAIRRVTAPQYKNIVHDLLGETVVLPAALEPDVNNAGLIAIGASLGSISARGVEQYEAAAYDLARQAFADDGLRSRLVPCQPTGQVDDACAEDFLTAFGASAWRRPLEEDEIERLVEIAGTAAAVREDFYGGLEFALAAILQSPNFLFRIEVGEADPSGAGRRFTDHEMASRLSFLLWNSTPDEALLEAAQRGELTDDEGLAAQVDRLMASERLRVGVRNFFTELFELHLLDKLSKDPTLFEHISPEVGPAAREETLLGLEHLIFEEDGDYRDIITTRRTFLNRKLASIYNIQAPSREGFAETELPEEGQRTGLMGQISFLALHSHPVSSSATLRGMFVRETLLCQTVPPPPANVDTSIPEASGDKPTLRDRVQEHLSNEACSGCHLMTDSIGLGYENFDGIGRFRLRDNDVIIDASGDLDGDPFETPRELNELLRGHSALGPCLVKHLYRYANGHIESAGERDGIDLLSQAFAQDGYRVQALLRRLVLSPGFRRAGEVE
jgi:hypothetical protein